MRNDFWHVYSSLLFSFCSLPFSFFSFFSFSFSFSFVESSTTSQYESSEGKSNSRRGSAIRKRSHLVKAAKRERFGQFRPFSSSSGPYRTRNRPPALLVPILEGHDVACAEYQRMLQSQILGVFELLEAIHVPTAGGSSKVDEPVDLKGSMRRMPKSVARRHTANVMKELAEEEERREQREKQRELAANANSEFSLKELQQEYSAAMDAADALMILENLTWAGLFHMRYRYAQRLLRESELEHIKAVSECFLSSVSNNDDDFGPFRKQASKLMQYVVSHGVDPDGALIGLAPSESICKHLRTSLMDIYGENSSHVELRDKVIGFKDDDGSLTFVPSPIAHGTLVIANMPEVGMRFCRFSRIDPVRTHMLQVFEDSFEQKSLVIDMRNGVFGIEASTRALIGSDPGRMGQVVFNPLTPLLNRVQQLLNERVEFFLQKNGADMYLLGLSEADLASNSLDWKRLDPDNAIQGNAQAECTTLLSLFDGEKKKLLSLRQAMEQKDIEDVMRDVSELVDSFMRTLDASKLFLPIKAVEIEAAYALGLRGVAAFQQTLDDRAAQLEQLIDFVIVNWKKLSDSNLRSELQKSGGSRIRSRSVSRGSGRSMLASSNSSSPMLTPKRDPSTPGSKRKGGTAALRTLFSSKKE